MRNLFQGRKKNQVNSSEEYNTYIENLKKTCAQLERYLYHFISSLLIQDTDVEVLKNNNLYFIELKEDSLVLERFVELSKRQYCNGQLQFLLAVRHLYRQTLKLISKRASKQTIEEEIDFHCRAIVIRFTPNSYMHDYVTNKGKKLALALEKIQSKHGYKLSADEIRLFRPPANQSREGQTSSSISLGLSSPTSLMSSNISEKYLDDKDIESGADDDEEFEQSTRKRKNTVENKDTIRKDLTKRVIIRNVTSKGNKFTKFQSPKKSLNTTPSNSHLTTLRSEVETLNVSEDLFNELLKKFFSQEYIGIDDFLKVPERELPLSVYTGIISNNIVGGIINLLITNFNSYLSSLSQTSRCHIFLVRFETFFEQEGFLVARKNKCCFSFSAITSPPSFAMNLCIKFREKLKKLKAASSAEQFCSHLIENCILELGNIRTHASKLIKHTEPEFTKDRIINADLAFLERYKKVIVSFTEKEVALSASSVPHRMPTPT